MAFLQFTACVFFLGDVDGAWVCVCLHWAATERGEKESDVDRSKRERNRTTAEAWIGVILFDSILSTVHVVWAKIVVELFTAELPWNHQPFTLIGSSGNPG